LQNIALDLRQRVEGRNLNDAISEYAMDLQPTNPPVRVITTGPQKNLEPELTEEVFTIILEAIRNARRHGRGASVITVSLEWESARLTVTIEDDGCGFNVGKVSKRSIGLSDMRERAELVNSQITINSLLGQGTRVSLNVPLGIVRDET